LRVSLLEIGILVAVVLVIFMVTRIWRMGKGREKEQSSTAKTVNLQARSNSRRRLRISGIVLIVIGIVFLLANMSLFKWVMWSYVWLLVLIFIGLVMVLLFRK
jgi:hypothetical protein